MKMARSGACAWILALCWLLADERKCVAARRMLLDAVGSIWDSGYKYYLKHRAPGQVDAEGKPTSTVLGAVDIQGDWDAFSFRVSMADRDVDFGPMYDHWEGDIDWGMSEERSIWATWASRSCRC